MTTKDGVLLQINYKNKKTYQSDRVEFSINLSDLIELPPLLLLNEDSMQVEVIEMLDFDSDDFNIADFN